MYSFEVNIRCSSIWQMIACVKMTYTRLNVHVKITMLWFCQWGFLKNVSRYLYKMFIYCHLCDKLIVCHIDTHISGVNMTKILDCAQDISYISFCFWHEDFSSYKCYVVWNYHVRQLNHLKVTWEVHHLTHILLCQNNSQYITHRFEFTLYFLFAHESFSIKVIYLLS